MSSIPHNCGVSGRLQFRALAKIARSPGAAVLLAAGLTVTALPAQTSLEGVNGLSFRYHGDTIWRSRDSTMSRVVYRGDTAKRANFVHGKLTYTATYVMKGDLAMLVEHRDGNGKLRVLPDTSRLVPATIVTGELQMLEVSARSNALAARMANMRGGAPMLDEAPLYPSTPVRYPISANMTIVHHLDTVRYIRGCAEAPPVDTTVYSILVGDSLRRISPSPRTFGKQMLMAVRADMSSAMLRRRINTSPDAPAPASLPRLRKWPCDNR